MRCKYCGAVFHGENLVCCPFCEMDIEPENPQPQVEEEEEVLSPYEKERRARVMPYVPDDAKYSRLYITVLKGKGAFSPAEGSCYFFVIDDYWEIRIITTTRDEMMLHRLPCGEHTISVRMFPFDDPKLMNEATYARMDGIRIELGEEPLYLKFDQGTLFKSAKFIFPDGERRS